MERETADAKARFAAQPARPLHELPELGRASLCGGKDGAMRIDATHPLAMLRLIERHGRVEIRIKAHEIQFLLDWPVRRFTWTVTDTTQEGWARAAIELLARRNAPEPVSAPWRRLGLLAGAVFALTFCGLDLYFSTGWLLQPGLFP